MKFVSFQDLRNKYRAVKPSLIQKYVNTSIGALNLALVPVNRFVKHLLLIQGLDPNTVPGMKAQQELQQALDGAFTQRHEDSYDKDFIFHTSSWDDRAFQNVKKAFPDLDEKEFTDLTDIGELQDTIDPNPIDELQQLLEPANVSELGPMATSGRWLTDTGEITATSLKDALKKLVEISKHLESPQEHLEKVFDLQAFAQEVAATEDPSDPKNLKELFARTDYLKNLKATIKDYQANPAKKPKNPKIIKTKTGKTNAVKKTPKKDEEGLDIDKQVKELQRLITLGKIYLPDLDALVEQGLSKDVVAAWRKKYSKKTRPLNKKFRGSFSRG